MVSEDNALAAAIYTALRAATTNQAAITLVRMVTAEMGSAAKADKPIDPADPHIWAEALEWICEHLEEDNDQVLNSMHKAGRVLS